MDHSLSDPTASSSAMAPATTSRDGTPTPRSNKPPSAICLNELLMSRDGEEEEDLFMASPPANTTFNTSRASRGPTTHGGHGGTEGGELESVAVGFSTTTAIVHITGTGNGGALSPSRTTTSPDHFTSEYYYAGMAHLHGASKTDEEAKVRRRLPEARAGSSVGSSHAGEDGALEASPPTTEERTRGVLLPAGDDVGAPAHYLTSPHHQQQHLLSSEPSGASPPTARHLAPLPLPTTTPSRPLSYKEYRRQQRCKPRIGGGGNVANRGFTVGRGTTGLREGCNTNNNNSTALPSRSDSGVMGSSDGGTSNPSSLPLQAALYAALKSERDEEYLKWRSDRLSRSLYHTFQNTTNNNNNNNSNSGRGGGEPQKRKHSPLPLQLAMGSVVPPTEEMMDFEERRRRAIATERRARRKDREQSRHQHEAVVLDRRRRGLRGEAVDLPDCFYALVEEVGPLQSGVSVPPREAITANDHRKACAAQRILAQNQRVLMEEDRHIAAHEMKKQLHDALSAARTDEENFTKARREGSRRIDCHETQARLEAKRAEQRGVAMQNRLRTEYDRMWANKYRIHEEEEELRRRQALREKVPGGGVVVSRHRSTSVVDSPTTIVPVPNSVPRQSAARPATGAGRAESAQHRQQSRVVFEPTPPPLPGTRTSNAAPVVEQPSSAAPTKANSIVASDTTNNNNKNNSTVANTTTTTALQSVKPSEVTAPSIHDPTSTNFFSEMKQWNTRFQSPNNTPASGRDPAHRRAWLQQLASDRQTFNDHSVNIIREELPAKMELAREEMYAAKVASADHSRGERAQLLQRRQQHHEEDRQHAAGVHAQYCDQLERLRQVRKDRVSELHRQADANRHTSEGCFLTAVEDGVRPPTS